MMCSSKRVRISCYKIERIKEKDSVRFLGVWLGSQLNFNHYHKRICKRLNFSLYTMASCEKYKTTQGSRIVWIEYLICEKSMKLLYHSLLHWHPEFSSTFLLASRPSYIQKIRVIQIKGGSPSNRISQTSEGFFGSQHSPLQCFM